MVHKLKKEKRKVKMKWYSDTDSAYTEAGTDSKVWRAGYKKYLITAYPLKLYRKGSEGWEYKIEEMNGNFEFDSSFETSIGGDHAETSEKAMRWAENTLNGMIRDREIK